MGGVGILDGVMEQSGGNGLRVQVQLLRHDLCHRQGMGDEGGAVLAVLTPVVGLGIDEGRMNQVKIGPGIILADGVLQPLVFLLYIHGCSPHFPLIYPCRAAQ